MRSATKHRMPGPGNHGLDDAGYGASPTDTTTASSLSRVFGPHRAKFMPTGRRTSLKPPIEPMLAKLTEELPEQGDFLYEPKWDGFRAIVFRDADVYIQSRDLRPFDRYFPEL